MNDRFKFRVWNETAKTYLLYPRVKMYEDVHTVIMYEDVYTLSCKKDEILEQCVGLKDINWKRIYEGDILKCGEYLYSVKWSDSVASFVLLNKKNAFLHYFGEAIDANECEVVGNIHENPELLKELDI